MSKRIVVIPGDGIGAEVTEAACRIIKQAAAQSGAALAFEPAVAGGAAIERCGCPLPAATIEAAKQADAILLGAVGGPQWDDQPGHLRPEQAILGLRRELGLYANLRPVRAIPALLGLSPLRPERVADVDILIVRELNGGIYYGERCEATVNAAGVAEAWDVERYSAPEVARIMHVACQAAAGRQGRVTSVDKANVLAASRLWRREAETIAADYAAIKLNHLYVDNAAMQLVLAPKQFDVIVTSNLFGDILSDEAAVLAGSIGLLPSASLGEGPGLYEPIHGSAPDIAGKGIANPLGTILAGAMLLRHSLDLPEAAAAIEAAVDAVLAQGYRTADLKQTDTVEVGTERMTDLVAQQLAVRA